MAVAGSLAALMVRWLRAGPVLLSGLLILAAADALGGLVRTVALIGADRSLHGAGAGIAARFAVVCAVTGFTLSPAAGAVTALTRSSAHSGAAVLVAALAGAGLAAASRQPQARAVTATGLSVAAVGLAGIDLAGLYLPELAAVPGPLVAVLCVPVAGGLAAALTAAFRTAGAAGALAGVVILLAGLVAGYLAAGAVQLHAIAGTVTAPAARAALAAAAGHWALVAAAVTGAVAVAMACTPGRARRGRTGESAGGAPVLGAGGIPDHG